MTAAESEARAMGHKVCWWPGAWSAAEVRMEARQLLLASRTALNHAEPAHLMMISSMEVKVKLARADCGSMRHGS